MTKDRTLIIFNPSIEGGGVEKNLFTIINFLSKKIEKIKLISSNPHKGLLSKNVDFLTIKNNFKKRFPRYFISLIILVNQIIKDKNLLVFSFQANVYAIIICYIFKVPIIIRANSSPTAWARNRFKQFVYRFFFKYPKYIIVNSYEFKKIFDKLFKVSCVCIYNPLNKNEIIKNSKKKVKLTFFKKKKLNIINIGRLTDQKDQLTILKALVLIKNKIKFKLLILGRGYKKNCLIKFAKKKGILNSLKILNFNKNPYPFIKKADVFVLSSKYEGLPNVLLEAITLKKFIISTNCFTGPAEILKNGNYGDLFEVDDHITLGNKILNFYNNKNKNKFKIKSAYNSLFRFDLNSRLNDYLNIIKKEI
jgi:glycosyltransferase involved in cell wall biosynthesis